MSGLTTTREDWQAGGFGVYIHWPFCAAKCPYCDFNSHVRREIDHDRWERAYEQAISTVVADRPDRRVDSIYFGGGTPSLMSPETVASVIRSLRLHWDVAPEVEITLEANPTSVEAGKLSGFHDAGVNRISLGVQALTDSDLRALGRMHTASEARAAFDLARKIFPRVSLDLIHSRQYLSHEKWHEELTEALAMASDHLSLYQLTIEPQTRFGELAAEGRLSGLPDDDTASDMYFDTDRMCEEAGFLGYEISNYSRPGGESHHNLVYWRGGDYVGIGPGAHGRITRSGTRFATEDLSAPEAWLTAVETDGHGRSLDAEIPSEEHAIEYLLMSMRLKEGCDFDRYRRLAIGREPGHARLEMLLNEGLIVRTPRGISATAKGRPVLNAILAELVL